MSNTQHDYILSGKNPITGERRELYRTKDKDAMLDEIEAYNKQHTPFDGLLLWRKNRYLDMDKL